MTRPVIPGWRPLPALLALLTLVGALGIAAPALAQNTDTIDISVNDNFEMAATDETLVANIRECRGAVGETWDFIIDFAAANYSSGGTRSDYALKVETSSGACSADLTEDTDTCRIVKGPGTIPSNLQVTWTTTFDALVGVDSPAGCVGKSGTVSLVVVSTLQVGTGSTDEEDGDPITDRFSINFRTARPSAPSALTATAGEGNIRLSFTAPSDAPSDATYNVYLSPATGLLAPDGAPEEAEAAGARRVTGSASTSISIDSGLSVDTTYEIAVVTVDEDGNESLLSELLSVTTTPTLDFYEVYRDGGGGDEGGLLCAVSTLAPQAPGSGLGLLGLLGVLGAAVGWRRRLRGGKALLALVGAAGLLGASGEAGAQDRLENRPTGTFELRVGTYLPEVDADFSGDGPYKKVFKDESMLLVEAEVERIIWDGLGTFGIGVDFGFMQAVGKALDPEGSSSVDTTVFNIIPLRVAAVYRFDLLTRELGIPLVLVGKLGLDYYLWWITDGAGDVASSESGGDGFGGTLGWHIAPALHLHLDGFSPRSANNLSFDFGIENSYLFAEYLITTVDDFGSSSSINLSDSALMFGIAFDY